MPHGSRPHAPGLSRRSLLAAGAATLAVGGTVTGCRGGGDAGARLARQVQTDTGTITSAYLPNEQIAYEIVRPDRPARGLVIALHGYSLNGPKMMDVLDVGAHVQRTGLAVAAVSGGDYYWHKRRAVTSGNGQHPGVDPAAMVVQDFVPIARKLTGVPDAAKIAFLGFSMGGYGALLLASDLGPDLVYGVVAASAALSTDPAQSAAGAFDDREDFLAHDVFTRANALAHIPIRLDCGRDDYFYAANKAFAKRVPHALVTFDDGDHTAAYWRSHAGAQLDWLLAQLG